MPELPEVETIASLLRNGSDAEPSLLGQVISGSQILWERTLTVPGPAVFTQTITGKQVAGISRRGKFLLISLGNQVLIVHLRMSGNIRVEPALTALGEPGLQPHDRLVINFESGWRMVFNDTRKFGRVWLVDDSEKILRRLGPEPFDPNLDDAKFFHMLQSKNRMLKPLLMDQHFLAGMGNIYTDEALFRSRIHPLRLSSSLIDDEASRLLRNIREVMQSGIDHNGSSIDWVYRGGNFQNHFQVYARAGEACYACGTPIEKIIVGQRGTHYCPVCQPKPTRSDE